MKYSLLVVVACLLTMGCSKNIVKAQANEPLSSEKLVPIPGSEAVISLALIENGTTNIENKEYQISPFYIAKTETTYDQYILFQDKYFDSPAAVEPSYDVDAISRPSPPYEDFTKGMGKEEFPAVSMTQQAALRYCQWLYSKTGFFFRLPTEAEWQYACELGQTNTSMNLEAEAWYYENANEKFQKAGVKSANALGVSDLLGNVAEWTIDEFQENYEPASQIDPIILPSRKHSRTVKGGSYLSTADECTCPTRMKSDPKWQRRDPQIPKSKWWNPDSPFVGFRVVMPVLQPDASAIEAFFKKVIID